MLRCVLTLVIFTLMLENVICDTNYRLNTTIIPSEYSILITPYFDTGDNKAFTFDGQVNIKFTTTSNINQIKLHSEDLIFSAGNITLTGGAAVNLNPESGLQFDEKYNFALINLQSELQTEIEYNLRIVYVGPIRKDLKGFYKNYYYENGVKKWLGATQMESTHARKVFPCFDEPALKAVFTLTIDRPAHYQQTLTNTKLQTATNLTNGYVRELFYPSPKMSTYLVAFLVSEFEAGASITNGSNEFAVYTRPDAKNQTAYAFDFGHRVVNALGEYFGIDYYSTNSNLRLDHVALPDFSAGAMENWGLIKYREALLLYVPEVSTPYYKYRVAQIVAHETTHMWFGNLVTCHWWSNTWLNEGFANYFQDYITALIEPDVGSGDILVTGSVYSAYDADDSPDSAPITNDNVNSPAEISGHFGTITYQKAGSVIRMMHHLLGDESFKFGLNSYLRANEFNVGYPDKLYTKLHDAAVTYNAFAAYPETDITSVMSSWISKAGHPVLQVDVNYNDNKITLTQKRFYVNFTNESDELYKIPITLTTGLAPNFNNTKPLFIMHNKTETIEMQVKNTESHWVIVNLQETGFYRVNYDMESWRIIADALKGNDREKIHHLNRAKIVNDLFAFVYADVVKFELLHDVLDFMTDETHYSVWNAAIRGLNKLRTFYLGSDALDIIEDYALQLVDSIINKLGYEVKPSDDFVTLRNRMQVMEFACKLGHQGCVDYTYGLFKRFRENGTEVPASLRTAAYCTGLRYGDGDDYEFLWNRMSTNNVASEARTIGEILGCTNEKSKLNSYLVSMLVEDSPIRTQDLSMPLSSVLSNYGNVGLVLEALQQNFTLWNEIYTTSIDTILTTIATSLHTAEEFKKFDDWLNSCTQCTEQNLNSARGGLTKARAVTTWAENHKTDIVKSLKSLGTTASASLITIMAGVMFSIYAKTDIY